MTKSAALEYAAKGIRINAVCPDLIHTAMADQMIAAGQAEALDAMLKTVPIGRLGRADEIADAVLWLCSPFSSLVVGHSLAVDGGHDAHRDPGARRWQRRDVDGARHRRAVPGLTLTDSANFP